jgi:hypothetical protein
MQCAFWTCSAELGDSVLDLNEPDLFGQLPSVSENRSAKPSSESIGPTSQSTMMSEPSTQMDLEELISSAAVSHASRGPLPGSNEAQKMTVTSGRSWLPLLQTYGLDGSLARMCEALLANRWASSAVFLTWKTSATAPSHLLFQLVPSMPRTDEIGSGLWPTPTASDYKGGRRPETLAKSGRGERNSLNDAVTMRDQHGSLNPTWVEWLMGFPPEYTDLGPWEMPSSRKSLNK